MKYSNSLEIDVPRARVVVLVGDPDNYGAGQEGLVSHRRVKGESGQEGMQTILHHKMGKREIEMLETVTERALPESFPATYEAKGVWNQAINRFSELEGDRTLWVLETEFRCKGFMRFLTTIAPGMFKKQTQAAMEAFKAFVESGEASPDVDEATVDPDTPEA